MAYKALIINHENSFVMRGSPVRVRLVAQKQKRGFSTLFLFFMSSIIWTRTLRGPRKSADLWGGAMVSCSDPTRAASHRAKLIGAAESG